MKLTRNYNLQVVNPALAREWLPQKNVPEDPRYVTPGSGKKVWWKCRKGHEWRAFINNRNSGRGCPYCSGLKACEDNCLQTLNPALDREWHPTKNKLLTPKDVTPGSDKKVWWKCKKGHEWQAQISARNSGSGCPYCSGSKVCEDNCLQTLNPALAREWHPTKNKPLTPKDVTPGSGKKVWWNCKKGHEWRADIIKRTYGVGCPYCAGKIVCNDNCLQARKPELAREWHPTKNKPLTPKDVTPGSNKKVWWLCEEGHTWRAVINSRTHGNGCPYCAGRIVCSDNCLQARKPKLAREWHPTKNKPLTPKDVTPGSNKKVWWICEEGHTWRTVISSRTHGTGCRTCHIKSRYAGKR